MYLFRVKDLHSSRTSAKVHPSGIVWHVWLVWRVWHQKSLSFHFFSEFLYNHNYNTNVHNPQKHTILSRSVRIPISLIFTLRLPEHERIRILCLSSFKLWHMWPCWSMFNLNILCLCFSTSPSTTAWAWTSERWLKMWCVLLCYNIFSCRSCCLTVNPSS